MDAQTLLIALAGRGIRVTCEGESLRVVPKEKLTDVDRVALRGCKQEILTLLQSIELVEVSGDEGARADHPIFVEARQQFAERTGVQLPPGLVPFNSFTRETYTEQWQKAHPDRAGAREGSVADEQVALDIYPDEMAHVQQIIDAAKSGDLEPSLAACVLRAASDAARLISEGSSGSLSSASDLSALRDRMAALSSFQRMHAQKQRQKDSNSSRDKKYAGGNR